MTAMRSRPEEGLHEGVVPQQLSGIPEESVPRDPWMDMFDENAMTTASLDWDTIDSLFNHDSGSFDSDPALAAPALVQDVPLMGSNAWPTQYSGVQGCVLPEEISSASFGLSNTFMDPNAFTCPHPDYQQSSCSSLSPQTPFLDQGQQHFASYDISPAETSAGINPCDEPSQLVFDQVAAAFRDLARARAEADPRPLSRKQKQRDASIALYLQRLRDTCNDAVAVLGSDAQLQQPQHCDSFTTDSSGCWPENTPDLDQLLMSWQPSSASASNSTTSFDNNLFSDGGSRRSSPESCTEPSSGHYSASPGTPVAAPAAKKRRTVAGPVTGGVELVMDLNMNAATSMPRKHRPRTQAQRERYLAVRNQGACEKHKKQHKRCTCIDPIVEATSACKQGQVDIRRSRANRSPPRMQAPRQVPSGELSVDQGDHSSRGICPGGCQVGNCYCVNCDSEESRWQLQFSTCPQQQSFVGNNTRVHRERGQDNRNVESGRSHSPTGVNVVVNPTNSNSEVTWDLAAVSRDSGAEMQGTEIRTAQNRRAQNRVMHSISSTARVGTEGRRSNSASCASDSTARQVLHASGEQRRHATHGALTYGDATYLHYSDDAQDRSHVSTGHDPEARSTPSSTQLHCHTSTPDILQDNRRHTTHTQDVMPGRSAVSSGTLPPTPTSYTVLPDAHCSVSTRARRNQNLVQGMPTGMGRYDISDISSATRISLSAHHPTATPAPTPPPSSSSAPLSSSRAMAPTSYFSAVANSLWATSSVAYHGLRWSVSQTNFRVPVGKSGSGDSSTSSFGVWLVIWTMLLLLSSLLPETSTPIESYFNGNDFV